MKGGMRELSGVVEVFYMLSGVVVTQMHTVVGICGTVCLKWAYFTVYKLHLNKVDLKY